MIKIIYNLAVLFNTVREKLFINLTICCRKREWNEHKNFYNGFLRSVKINIVHKSGKKLESLYSNGDICLLYFPYYEYRTFGMPVKLFEYMAYHKPIIASNNCVVGEYIHNNIGWKINYDNNELSSFLNKI